MADLLDEISTALADRYRIERRLGEGGMATVYLAEDLRHDRKVAVKVLKPELAAVLGAERFVQEIKTTASLQHPHILPLFDSGEADAFLFYVMPYIEGETLRDKLDRETQLGIEDAVKITTGVADALDYAHRHDVIHRDIKPENILLHDGRPIVADFGIALAVSAAAGGRMTETGISLGTPHYMSPEQATADKHITHCSDLYSLGCVLYEMLTGEPPHTGATAQAIIMKIVTDQPRSVTELRTSVPAHVAAAVAKALEKLPADRFAGAQHFAHALADPRFRHGAAVGSGAGTTATPWNRLTLMFAASGVVVGALAAWALARPEAGGPSVYDVALPDSAPMAFKSYRLPAVSVSPDGRFAVYVADRGGRTELWYRSLRDADVRPIAGTDGAVAPMVAPTGDRVAFLGEGRLSMVPIAGGALTTIAEVAEPSGAQWGADGRILVADNDGRLLRWFDPATGERRTERAYHCVLAAAVPDTDAVVCTAASHHARLIAGSDRTETVLRPRGRAGEELAASLPGADFRLVADHYLTYTSQDAELRATRFDPAAGTVGRPATLVAGVRREGLYGASQYAVSASGTLVYGPGSNAEVGRLVKRLGSDPPQPLLPEPAAFLRFSLSRDASLLAAVVRAVGEEELRVYDLASGQHTVWLRARYIGTPLWSRTGDDIVVPVVGDGSPPVTVMGSPTAASAPDTILTGLRWSPYSYRSDGWVFGWEPAALQAIAVDVTSAVLRVDTLREDAYFPALSPDGRWLTYQARATGQVLVEPHPALNRRYQVSEVGWEAQWTSGSELVYWLGNDWYRVTIDRGAERPVGEPRLWFTDPRFSDTLGRSYSVTPDGGVIYVQGPARTTGAYLRVVPNWVEQMKRVIADGTR